MIYFRFISFQEVIFLAMFCIFLFTDDDAERMCAAKDGGHGSGVSCGPDHCSCYQLSLLNAYWLTA